MQDGRDGKQRKNIWIKTSHFSVPHLEHFLTLCCTHQHSTTLYVFIFISFQQRRILKICPFIKTKCFYLFFNKSNFLHYLGLPTSFSQSFLPWHEEEGSWQSWANWRVSRKTSELVVNGASGLSALGLGTWTPPESES